MKAYDENAKYILFINKSITILGCSTVNSLTIGFLGHISQQSDPHYSHQVRWDHHFGSKNHSICPADAVLYRIALMMQVHWAPDLI